MPPSTRILRRFTLTEYEEALAVVELDLETVDVLHRQLSTAAETLSSLSEWSRIARPGAPVSLYVWPGTAAVPKDPKFLGFVEAASSSQAVGSGVQVPGTLPVPDFEPWTAYTKETSVHLQDGEPVVEWLVTRSTTRACTMRRDSPRRSLVNSGES